MTTTCCQIDLLDLNSITVSRQVMVYSASRTIYQLCRSCLHRSPVKSERPACGQSIVNFDYGMAPGIAKTYHKRYTSNLQKAIELYTGSDAISEDNLKELRKSLIADGKTLRMGDHDEYQKCEAEELKKLGVPEDIITKAQKFAADKALSETDPRSISGNGGVHSQPQHHELACRSADSVFVDKLRHGYLSRGQNGYEKCAACE